MDNVRDMPKETPSPSPVPNWEQPPDTPEVSYNWVDITEDFEIACNTLQLGELVHEPNFGLFEAMSAIEMMDPKMDAGMIGKQTNKKVLSFQECLEQKRLTVDNFNPSDLIIIMDTCQSCILSWLDGQSLAQTVFTCLYLHNPDVIEDRRLRAYCLGVLKLCNLIKDKIYKANVFEEEDFQTLTYGFQFANEVTELRVVGMLKEVEDEVGRKIRSLKSNPQAHAKEADSTDAIYISELRGVLARIKFLRIFLQVIIPFGKKEVEMILASRKQLVQLTEQLKIIDSTMHLGRKPEFFDGQEVVIGFEPLVNQRLLPPTFPRYTKLRSRNEILSYYSDLIKRVVSIIEMTTLTSFQAMLDFVIKFSQSGPCVLTRSLTQIVFVPENRKIFGNHSLTEVIKESLRSFNSPPGLSPRCPNLFNNAKAKQNVDDFLTRASRTMMKVMQVYGHNYARQREKLANLLEDLANLQDDADRCDSELHSIMQTLDVSGTKSHLTCIGNWTLYHTLRVMIQYVLSGFQLQLYSEHELHYIYWYLSEVLISWQINTMNRAENHLQKDEALALAEQQQSSKSRKSKKIKKNKRKTRLHSKELLEYQGMQLLAAGCFKALLGLLIDGKLKTPDFAFDNEATRYEHRFSAFICVTTPPFMPYKQFQEMTDMNRFFPQPSAQDVYSSSAKHFDQAKRFYESIAASSNVQQLLQVAKTNLVVTNLLAGGHKQSSTTKPIKFDFSVCTIFPILRLS